MKVKVIENNNVDVGDIIELDHKGSSNESNFYLICNCNSEGYFIMNFSGKKSGRIKFYPTLKLLLDWHSDSIIKIYSKKEWEMGVIRGK